MHSILHNNHELMSSGHWCTIVSFQAQILQNVNLGKKKKLTILCTCFKNKIMIENFDLLKLNGKHYDIQHPKQGLLIVFKIGTPSDILLIKV